MAADSLSLAGLSVTIYEAMPTLARKFLLAGKSGLNITHSEEYVRFSSRFGEAGSHLKAALDDFMPDDVRAWAADLGTETFIGSSGRVFPKAMKASPLLRAWIKALQDRGVMIRTRHRWTGFSENGYRFATPDGDVTVMADAVVLALGGASWPRLGSDAAWVPWLRDTGVAVTDFKPANCGFDIAWSDVFRERFAGQPVKSVVATSAAGQIQGEFVISRHGIEGSLIYAHAAALRDDLRHHGKAELLLDLAPGKRLENWRRILPVNPQRPVSRQGFVRQPLWMASRQRCCGRSYPISPPGMPHRLRVSSRLCRCRCCGQDRWRKRFPRQVASTGVGSTAITCWWIGLACSWPEKCWIGKRQPAAIC